MQEGNSPALSADARDVVDERGPRGAAALENGIQIPHGETDVMYGGASPGDKPPDWRIRLLCFEQLHNRAAGVEPGNPRAVGVGKLDLRQPQNFPVKRESLGDGAHGNSDMGDS